MVPMSSSHGLTQAHAADRRIGVALVAVLVIGAALRLANLAGQSLWLDEAFSVVLAQAPWHSFVYELRTREANMGFYFLVLRPWLRIGTDEASVRLLSALLGIATMPAVAALATRLFDRRVGLYAALLLAADPLAVWASQEARAYSLVALLVTCSTWALVRGMDADAAQMAGRPRTLRARSVGRWSLYVATSALAVYAHFYAVLVLAAQCLSLGSRPPPPGVRWSVVIASGAAIAVLLLPLALFLTGAQHGNIDWLRDAIASGVPIFVHQLLHSAVFAALFGYAILWVGVGWATAQAARRAPTARARWAYLLALLWLAFPVAVPLLVSVAFKPVIEPRYLTVCIPGFAIAAAAVTSRLTTRSRRLVLGAILALEAFGDWAYFARFRKEDWRDATQTVLADVRPGDAVIFYAPYVRRPFDYYLARAVASAGQDRRASSPRILYPSRGYADFTSDSTPPLALGQALDSARLATRAWLVLSHVGPDTACARDLDAALRSNLPLVEDRLFLFIDVRLYSSDQRATPGHRGPAILLAPRCPND